MKDLIYVVKENMTMENVIHRMKFVRKCDKHILVSRFDNGLDKAIAFCEAYNMAKH